MTDAIAIEDAGERASSRASRRKAEPFGFIVTVPLSIDQLSHLAIKCRASARHFPLSQPEWK